MSDEQHPTLPPRPVRFGVRDRWSRTVLVALVALVVIAAIAVTGILADKMDGGTLAACLMAVRECVAQVAGRKHEPLAGASS